jgi:hypothetical protein
MIIFRLILIISALSPGLLGQENAVEIVRKSNDLLRGVSSYSELRMRIEKTGLVAGNAPENVGT